MSAGLALRNEHYPVDVAQARELILRRWGVFRVVVARSDSRRWLAFIVDDGVDPTSYLIREVLNGSELAAQVQAEDLNAWRDEVRAALTAA
jgi:hypothetical protein